MERARTTELTGRWAAHLPVDRAHAAARLRLMPGIEVLERADGLWLRGADLDAPLQRALRSLPGARLFDVAADGSCRGRGRRVPEGTLPNGQWRGIDDWARVEIGRSALPGKAGARALLCLVRSWRIEEPNLLLVRSLETWVAWAVAAPRARLRRLAFAVDRSGRVLVRGHPLPPLRGDLWVERDGVAVPAGWELDPPLPATTVRRWLRLENGDLSVFATDGTYERVASVHLVAATRSAARLSLAGSSS